MGHKSLFARCVCFCCVVYLHSLSTRVFETRTAIGIELFSLLTCLHTNTFALLNSFPPLSWLTKCYFPLPSASQKRACFSSLLKSRGKQSLPVYTYFFFAFACGYASPVGGEGHRQTRTRCSSKHFAILLLAAC